jgi:UrcA family protein
VISNIVRNAAFVLAAGSAMIAVPASAEEIGTSQSMVVRHSDLDLTSDHGVAVLHRRIDTAARAVCGNFYGADLAARSRALACRKVARADAASDVEVAVAAARNGQQLAASAITVGNANP